MLNKAIIDQFYKDVEALGLKFPVAAIAEATGFSKGNVSDYLKKRREPSQGFLNRFYEKFSDSLQKVPGDGKIPESSVPPSLSKDETIAILVRQVSNLNEISRRLEELEEIARQNFDVLNRLLQTGDTKAGERAVQATKRGASQLKK